MIDTEQERIKAICRVAHINDISDLSDGYHTFKQLYHQRAILFATIINQNKDKAWKSYRHSDGKYCFDSNGAWFIVGIDTPEGSYTYHYSKEYWDYFECTELECGKEWDGHTEKDVTRLLSLKQELCADVISRQAVIDAIDAWVKSMHILVTLPANDVTPLFDSVHKLPPVAPAEKVIINVEKSLSEPAVTYKGNLNYAEDGFVNKYCRKDIRKIDNSSEKSNKWIDIEVIEKIRSEIESKTHSDYTGHNEYEMIVSDGYEGALKIIDKYISSTGDKT